MCEADRWDREKKIVWQSVRSVWLKRVGLIRALVQDIEVIIEKSPPNLVRMDQLTEVFPNHSVTAYNRDPYANCSSILYRYRAPRNDSEEARVKIVSEIAAQWLSRSGWIKRWIEKWQLTHFTYEQFCADPAACVSKVAVSIPALRTVDSNRSVKVKDHGRQGIVDFNAEQISRLSDREVDAISGVLAKDLELVSFFGYEVSG